MIPTITSVAADQRRVEPCGACAFHFSPPRLKGQAAPIVGSPVRHGQTCYRHPNRETGVSCSNCGRPICPDCMTPTPVGMRCPECASQRTQVTRGAVGAGSLRHSGHLRPDRAQRRRLPGRDRRRRRRAQRHRRFGRQRLRPARRLGRRRRVVPAADRRLPPRRPHPHRLQHVRPLHPRPLARAGDRHAALRRALLRLALRRRLRRAAALRPDHAHGGRLGSRLRSLRRRLRHRPRPRPRHDRLAARVRAPASTWRSPSASPTSASAATSAASRRACSAPRSSSPANAAGWARGDCRSNCWRSPRSAVVSIVGAVSVAA